MFKNLFTPITILFFCISFKSQTPGTLDLNFGNQGIVKTNTMEGYVPYDISIQKNSGEIFVCGIVNKVNSSYEVQGFVKKFDFYGIPKSSFGQNGDLKILFPQVVNQRLYQIVPDNSSIQTSGFYVRGKYNYINNNPANYISYISKHNEDGSLDSSYGNNGILNIDGQIKGNYIYSLGLNSQTGHQYLKRYHLNDGTLDNSFANIELPNPDSEQHFESGEQYNFINVQNNGKIVLVGYDKINATTKSTVIVRFNANGTLDYTFGNGGFYKSADSEIPHESVTQSDGKIIFISGFGRFKRLNENGTIDLTYGNNGIVDINTGNDFYIYNYNLKIQNDDKVYFSGTVYNDYYNSGNTQSQYLARLNNNGFLDFVHKNFESEYDSEIWSTALINDSFIITNGEYQEDINNKYSVLQRIYTKAPVLSLYGNSTNNIDIDLNSVDYKVFTNGVNLTQGTLRFRLDHKNDYNWGGLSLSGNSTIGKNDIQIPNSGFYNVNFNLQNGEYSIINQQLSVNDFHKNNIDIYPNPAKNMINFNKIVYDIKIYDQTGKLIYYVPQKTKQVNFSHLPQSLYYVDFKTEDGSLFRKRIIKK